MTNTSRYSYHARRALTHAGLLTERYRHVLTDTGHLLVGVMLTDGSIGHQVLYDMHLEAAQAEPYLKALYDTHNIPDHIPHNTDAMKMTLDLAASEAQWLSHHYIGTEHLLLGITRANAGKASDLLRQMGSSPEYLRSRVRRALEEGASEMSLQMAKQIARLSELSRRVINAAEQQAVALDHPTVGIGHLLLVMSQETRSPIAAILIESGFDVNRLWQGLEDGDPALLVGIELILGQVRDLVEKMGSHYTGTEHLLLTLLADPAGEAVVRACGADPAYLRRKLQPK